MPANVERRAELAKLVPYGLLVTRGWLADKGLERHSLDNLVKSGQLIPLASGVYKRPETTLKWQGMVCSLQRMGSDLVVGGMSAFELQGLAHYLSLSSRRTIHLYGYDALPSWVKKLDMEETFRWHGNARLWGAARKNESNPGSAYTVDLPWGDQSRTLKASTPERAIYEVLADVPEKVSFEHAEQLMQGLPTLSPRRLEALLHSAKNVKAKRLFFWFGERQNHAWFKKLDPSRFDLGRGKRVLVKAGKLDKKYQITVPEEMNG